MHSRVSVSQRLLSALRPSQLWIVALASFVASCGSQSDAARSPAPTRVEVSPSALLLTEPGEQAALRVSVLDEHGLPMAGAHVAWKSARPEQITVDDTGTVNAIAEVGSTTVIATVNGVDSFPVTVLVAQPAADAVLLADAEVLDGPTPIDSDTALSIGAEYQITIDSRSDVVPGAILLAKESKPIAGRVESVTDAGATSVVVFQLVAIPDLFQRLDYAGDYPVELDSPAGAGSGPAPLGAPSRRPLGIATGNGGCKPSRELGGVDVNLGFDVKAENLDYTSSITYDKQDDLLAMTLSASGELVAAVSGALIVAPKFTGKYECKFELARKTLPIGGPISLLIGVQVVVGAKAVLEVSTIGPRFEIGGKGELRAHVGAGLAYSRDTGWVDLNHILFAKPTFEPRLVTPDLSDLRAEASLSVGPTVGLDAALPLLAFIDLVKPFGLVQAFGGVKVEAKLASLTTQLKDPGYASGYGLKVFATVGVADDAKGVLEKLAGEVAKLSLSAGTEYPLLQSPTGKGRASPTEVPAGDPVKVVAAFAPDSVELPSGTNIRQVDFYLVPPGKMPAAATLAGSAKQFAPNDTEVKWTWQTSPSDAPGEYGIYPVVIDDLAGLSLEISDDSRISVNVVADCRTQGCDSGETCCGTKCIADCTGCQQCDEQAEACVDACPASTVCCGDTCIAPCDSCHVCDPGGGGGCAPKCEGQCTKGVCAPVITKLYCACNGKCYDSPSTCVNACVASLSCFNNICAAATKEQCPIL